MTRSLALAALLVAGAARADEPCALTSTTTLFLGRSIPDGGRVSERAWRRFVADEVAPRLPGFTTWRAEGGWRDDAGHVVREATFVLRVDHAGDVDPTAIARAYAARFRQTSVLVSTTPSCGVLTGP